MRVYRRSKFLTLVTLAALGSIALAQENEFRIGALTPLTGAGSPYGPGMLAAIKLAVEEINQAGGVLGKKVVVISEDDQTDPEAAVRAAKKLIEVNRVSAIIGTWSSGVTMAVLPLTTKAGIIEMNTSGAPEISKIGKETGLVYRTQASNTLFGVVFSKVALKEGFKRAATMAFNNPSGLGNTQEFAKNFVAAGGVITASVVYEGGRTTYRSELEKALSSKPEVIVMGSYLPDTTIILKEWYQLNEPMHFIAPAWAVNDRLIKSVGAEVAEGVYAVDAVPNFGSKSYARFAEAYQKATGQKVTENPYSAMVYDATTVLALAIEAAKSTDPAVFKKYIRDVSGPPGQRVYSFAEGVTALKSGKAINYEGASSAIDFDESGDVRPAFGVYKVEKGKINLKYIIKP
ncbi:ABC transporter substrate-binding protein [Meiothermus sp. Pnk-1]|uniref:ABC transporter substrate-binding protein n=1 Tax=Meiothermus sp. Pnk-1 TaxID=873128 RepID=UPI000D7BC41F|nr:ABC transporter substrate-binding protein [Meiothermus sp. Pnk-1]PZA07545.1 amino acid ABC transporter substrate-binding protein [Meiothermus sp. Pnk-1]